jgi:hypothetical protein
MALIEISDLNAAGSDLFVGSDSFLNELETTETNKIIGGTYGYGYKKYSHKKYSHGYKKHSHKKYSHKKYIYKEYGYGYGYKKGYYC